MKANHFFFFFLLLSFACDKKQDQPAPTRTYRMGFQNSAPRIDFNLIQQSLNIWTQRADAAIITSEVPWKEVMNGVKPQKYVSDNFLGLAQFYQTKNLKLWVYIEPANGLNRGSDANDLVAVGKSIADADAQKMYQRFVIVMDSMLRPDHLGLALETNLIKTLASNTIYQGVKKAANDAAAAVKARGSQAKLSVSIQVDDAWGKFSNQQYKGIDQDVIDFPFMEEVGMSSYPYFFFTKPQDIPSDYYSKLFQNKDLPRFVSEGGWPSESFMGITGGANVNSSLQLQQDYINKQSQLLDNSQAIAVFQLSFTDIDVSALPATADPTIKYFSSLGLVDNNLKSKISLDAWDQLFKRPLKIRIIYFDCATIFLNISVESSWKIRFLSFLK